MVDFTELTPIEQVEELKQQLVEQQLMAAVFQSRAERESRFAEQLELRALRAELASRQLTAQVATLTEACTTLEGKIAEIEGTADPADEPQGEA